MEERLNDPMLTFTLFVIMCFVISGTLGLMALLAKFEEWREARHAQRSRVPAPVIHSIPIEQHESPSLIESAIQHGASVLSRLRFIMSGNDPEPADQKGGSGFVAAHEQIYPKVARTATERPELARTETNYLELTPEHVNWIRTMIDHQQTHPDPNKTNTILAANGRKRGAGDEYQRASQLYDLLFAERKQDEAQAAPVYRELSENARLLRKELGLDSR